MAPIVSQQVMGASWCLPHWQPMEMRMRWWRRARLFPVPFSCNPLGARRSQKTVEIMREAVAEFPHAA
jgi:hypothetical protein